MHLMLTSNIFTKIWSLKSYVSVRNLFTSMVFLGAKWIPFYLIALTEFEWLSLKTIVSVFFFLYFFYWKETSNIHFAELTEIEDFVFKKSIQLKSVTWWFLWIKTSHFQLIAIRLQIHHLTFYCRIGFKSIFLICSIPMILRLITCSIINYSIQALIRYLQPSDTPVMLWRCELLQNLFRYELLQNLLSL